MEGYQGDYASISADGLMRRALEILSMVDSRISGGFLPSILCTYL